MKTLLSLTLLLATATLVTAQPTPPGLPAAPGTDARVSAAGPHATVWSRKVVELTPFGSTREVEHSYVQIQSGLNWLNAGAWVPAREEFDVYAGFCVATQAQHKVILAANLATAGAVDMELPDGTRVQSHLLGIALLDLASGKSILISEVKECVAVADGNQVVYPDAMTDFQVDVQYINSKAGFSQNLILRERPPLPERFGLDSRTTVMQVLTEFIHPPPVTLRAECVLRADGTEAIGSEVDFGPFDWGAEPPFAGPAGSGARKSLCAKRGKNSIIGIFSSKKFRCGILPMN
jgi:hypothetical protein